MPNGPKAPFGTPRGEVTAKKQSLDAKSEEQKYYGFNACMMLFRKRPDDIIRCYVTEDRVAQAGPLLKWCAKQRKAYHVVTSEEMERICQSKHHEGISLLAKQRQVLDQNTFLEALEDLPADCVMVYLDGVQNPHNLGAVLRTAAHFGASFVIGSKKDMPRLSASACRVAEGAVELIEVAVIDDLALLLQGTKAKGYKWLATSSHKGMNLFDVRIPQRLVVVLGGEVRGLSDEMFEQADVTVKIPGSGEVESLNVSVATGILLGEVWRARHN